MADRISKDKRALCVTMTTPAPLGWIVYADAYRQAEEKCRTGGEWWHVRAPAWADRAEWPEEAKEG